MVCLILYWMIAAAKTGILLNGTEGVIRTWYNKKDREDLADYNLLLKEVEMGAQVRTNGLNCLKALCPILPKQQYRPPTVVSSLSTNSTRALTGLRWVRRH